jgi:hypothetical protein
MALERWAYIDDWGRLMLHTESDGNNPLRLPWKLDQPVCLRTLDYYSDKALRIQALERLQIQKAIEDGAIRLP